MTLTALSIPSHAKICLLQCVHAGPRYNLLILVTQSRYLQEHVDAIALEAVQLEATRPVLGVDATQGQTHAKTQVGRPAGQRGEGALIGRSFEVSAGELVLDVQLLHGGGHAGDAVQVRKALLAERALAKGPEIGELLARYAAAAVRDADGDVLGRLGDGDIDGRGAFGWVAMCDVAVDDGLDRVTQELADDVLEVAEDEGEIGIKVALDADIGYLDVWGIDRASNLLYSVRTALDDVLGVALDEDLADKVGLGELSPWGEVRRVVCLGEGEVLLGNDTATDALAGR